MPIRIPIIGGEVLVDEKDARFVLDHPWRARSVRGAEFRVGPDSARVTFRLARMILGAPAGRKVYYANGDCLDCRRANISVGRMVDRKPFLDTDGVWKLPLTGGHFALIDSEDVERFGRHLWHVRKDDAHKTAYAVRFTRLHEGRDLRCLHHEVLRPGPGKLVDHINCNGLDNRRANLREATPAENSANCVRPLGESGFRGVRRADRGWRACISAKRRYYGLGTFATAEEAAHAYDAGARRLHGEFATLNFPHHSVSSLTSNSAGSGNMRHDVADVAFDQTSEMNRLAA